MSELIVPGLVAAAAVTLTYLFCVRPMRNGAHCAMPGMSKSTNCSDAGDNEEIQRLRADLATLRRDLNTNESASNTSPGDSNPTVKPH